MSSRYNSTSSRLPLNESCDNGGPLESAAQIASIVSGAGDAIGIAFNALSLVKRYAPNVAQDYNELVHERDNCWTLITTHDTAILSEDQQAWDVTIRRVAHRDKSYSKLIVRVESSINEPVNPRYPWAFWRAKISIPRALKAELQHTARAYRGMRVRLELISQRSKTVPFLRAKGIPTEPLTTSIAQLLSSGANSSSTESLALQSITLEPGTQNQLTQEIPLSDIPSLRLRVSIDEGSGSSNGETSSKHDPFVDPEEEQSSEVSHESH